MQSIYGIRAWTTENLQHLATLKRKISYHDESEDEDMPKIIRMKIDHKIV